MNCFSPSPDFSLHIILVQIKLGFNYQFYFIFPHKLPAHLDIFWLKTQSLIWPSRSWVCAECNPAAWFMCQVSLVWRLWQWCIRLLQSFLELLWWFSRAKKRILQSSTLVVVCGLSDRLVSSAFLLLKKWTRFHIWLFPKSFFLFDRLILGFRSNDGLNYITLSLILRVPVKKIPNVSSTLGFFNHPSSSTYPTQNHGRAGVYPSCHRVRWEVHTGQPASLL